MNFIAGVITGIIIATVGLTGVAQILDRSVAAVQNQARTLVKQP
jgi:hypothetical protein